MPATLSPLALAVHALNNAMRRRFNPTAPQPITEFGPAGPTATITLTAAEWYALVKPVLDAELQDMFATADARFAAWELGWHPITTAPSQVTPYLLTDGEEVWSGQYNFAEQSFGRRGGMTLWIRATHWQHLPPPPIL